MIDSFDPHEPWDPPRYYTNLYDDPNYDGYEYVTPSYRPIEGYLTEAEFKHVQAMYAGEITMVDRWLGFFLEQVEIMGLMDKTMIIITTDHGTYNGDHGQVGKLQTHMYQGISHIPMIIWHPEFGHGERLKQLVQPIDIFPTVLEAVGLKVPKNIHGKSLIPLLEGKDEELRDAAIFGRFNFSYNVTDGEYVLYRWLPHTPPADGMSKTALFHLPSDPKEENNIAESDDKTLLRMQRLLKRKLEEINAPQELLKRLGLDK